MDERRSSTKGVPWAAAGLLIATAWLFPTGVQFDRDVLGQAPSAMVRWDWHFRESLRAIDDWETILAELASQSHPLVQAPAYPVPNDGRFVEWIHPLPPSLLPPDDRRLKVRLRQLEESMEVRRVQVNRAGDEKQVSAERTAAGREFRVYQHPGGGGKNQWYHQYERRFDRLTVCVPQSSPLAVTVAPREWQFGDNPWGIQLRNATSASLPVSVRLEQFARCSEPGKQAVEHRVLAERDLSLPPRGSAGLPFQVTLRRPGGGILLLTVQSSDKTFRVPLATHVADLPVLLQGIQQVLEDSPNAAAATELAELRRRAHRALKTGTAEEGWNALFERASELRDSLLLGRIGFDSLVFVKRKPFYSEQPFMDAHHCYNRPGGGIYRLSPVRPDGEIHPVVESLGTGIYRDVTLHWDATRLLFAFGNGSDRFQRTTGRPADQLDGAGNYDLYETEIDGEHLRRLTSSPKNDCEPFYLPDGRIGFTSDRSEHFVMCGSDIHVANLFTLATGESDVRQLSSNVFNEFNPSLLPDGRIIYNRWEYNERSVTSLHNLFTMFPDGSHVAPYYGNATIRPNVIMFPRAVPRSNKVMALFTGHHGQTHGPIGVIDVRYGVDGPNPVNIWTPGVPTIGERIEDSRRGWYSDPRPLSETTFLCSFTPTVVPWLENSWALYVGDRHGNLALVFRDPNISCCEPVPTLPSPRPQALPRGEPMIAGEESEATLLMLDVYEGLPDVARGNVRYLRILEDVPRQSVPRGGVICTSGTQIYTIKRILGTVPVEADGSAHFVVPADRNVYFEVLDEQQREIQRMRSVVCLKPREQITCVGCHEPRTQAPVRRSASAFQRPPSRPLPPPWGTQAISFLRDVQPVLNEACVRCHAYDRFGQGVILTDDLTDQFSVGYEELLPFLNVANAMRWDHPQDVFPQPPYTYGSHASPLVKLLAAGHHDVALDAEQWERLVTWIDANAVYYDRYETYTDNRHIFTGKVRAEMEEVFARRCGKCHGPQDDGRYGNWWLTLNRHDPGRSRCLQAPLAGDAGGWQRCDEIVFADTHDADYQRLAAALTTLGETLTSRPRADLRSLHGSPAERQVVHLPEPPPSPPRGPNVASDGWVWLSDLPWQQASSGWTANNDGLPRRDLDVRDQRLRIGARPCRKGIGTHAPSEIEFLLEGRYRRFAARIGGAEANGTVVFQVYGDGRPMFDSRVMKGLGDVRDVDLDVQGVQRLRLIVTDAGDGYNCDMANWADARLQID